MRLTALASALAFSLVIPPAQSYTLLPETFAKRYCELRGIGATYQAAMDSAVLSSMIKEDHWIWITRNGRRERSDVIEGSKYIVKLCPKYMLK